MKSALNELEDIAIAFITVTFVPSFFVRHRSQRLLNAALAANGLVLGVAVVLLDPMVLMINPVMALLALLFAHTKNVKNHESA